MQNYINVALLFLAELPMWLTIAGSIIGYLILSAIVDRKTQRQEGTYFPFLFCALIATAVVAKIDINLFTWSNIAIFTGFYLVLGLVTAAIKWRRCLQAFHKKGRTYMDQNPRATKDQLYEFLINSYGSYSGYSILRKDESIMLGANSTELCLWCAYWPLFFVSVISRPISSFYRAFIGFFSGIFSAMSKSYKL